ncbi:trafficking protein particle complex subunit 11 [Biomphalaria pfeifferi]|uniref:Trafficking protein particle complex subunit 11 n=1 Tax=Biomphalaria pfeifferi TaxID=112525 RepID=A0AAD8BD03_BIOPF|nr:trafficking protein particle complex subunit 11 [Biomphalaria pfeifferi]
MFPDSAIASGFSCSTFGISPYLAEVQRKAVLSEKDYVLLFDETLNGPLQSKQLDVHAELMQESSVKHLNVGSCGLNIVHNSFKAGHSATSWDIGSWLSALHWLFKDSPARREDFINLIGTSTFALRFCGHRWLENVPTIQRALQIWPAGKVYLNKIKGDKSKESTCKSYKNLVDFAADALLEAKAQILCPLHKNSSLF